MYRKHLIGIGLSLLIFLGITSLFPYKTHISDQELIENFYSHRANFEKIARLADEDSGVQTVGKDYCALDGYEMWRKEGQEGFSTERWNEYKQLFDQLGSPYIHRISKKGTVLQIASASVAVSEIDGYESVVISKGYAYSLNEPSPLVESLDEMGFEDKGIYYRRISENWYLYHDWGIAKPE